MVTEAVPKTTTDVVRELASLLMRFPLESPKVEEKIQELATVAREGAALPPYGTGLAAAKDALGQTLGTLLTNLPREDRRTVEGQFERHFEQEFRRLAPHIRTR